MSDSSPPPTHPGQENYRTASEIVLELDTSARKIDESGGGEVIWQISMNESKLLVEYRINALTPPPLELYFYKSWESPEFLFFVRYEWGDDHSIEDIRGKLMEHGALHPK
ncbi:MAG: hypothetical protein AAF989_08710 [Planctomycetota bacterium]